MGDRGGLATVVEMDADRFDVDTVVTFRGATVGDPGAATGTAVEEIFGPAFTSEGVMICLVVGWVGRSAAVDGRAGNSDDDKCGEGAMEGGEDAGSEGGTDAGCEGGREIGADSMEAEGESAE